MRTAFVGFMGLATCWTGAVRSEEPGPQAARHVELILMEDASAPDRWPGADARSFGAEVMTFGADVQSVELEMLARLQTQAISGDPGDMTAERGAQIPDSSKRLAPVSDIFVPMWMQPGALLSPETWHDVPGCASSGYRPTGFLGASAEMRRASYYGMMSRIACEHGIPVGLFDAMIIRESRYHPTTVSPKNAFGLTQLMPATAAGLGVDRYSVEGNLRGGARYLRQQLDTFGQYHLALAAYNAGPGRVRGGLVPRIRETQDYVGNVLSNWSRLSGLQRRAVVLPVGAAALQGLTVTPVPRRTAAVAIY